MKYRFFLKKVEEELKKRVGEDVRIEMRRMLRNNGVVTDSLTIMSGDENMSPVIYLDGLYESYCERKDIREVVDAILDCYRERKQSGRMDMSFFSDPELARKRIVCRIINRRKNRKLLEEVPHHDFLDLSVVFYYLMDRLSIGSAAVLIRNEHLVLWDIDPQELWKIGRENTRRLLPHEFRSMHSMMEEMLGTSLPEETPDHVPLYVLSNDRKSFGAVWITDPEVQREIGQILDDDYYVLPSSVHECMIVPARVSSEASSLQKMVSEINETQVEPEEVLGDSVYRYDRRMKKLRIAAISS